MTEDFMGDIVIAGAVRTAIGDFGGALKDIPATRLGSLVIAEAMKRAGVAAENVDEVILGCVLQAGLGLNPARQAALGAGLRIETPSCAVNEVCGSGLRAINLAAQAVRAGSAEVVVAGGMESMSGSPHLLKGVRWGVKMGGDFVSDAMIQDGLWCPFGNVHMGVTAENIATKFGISREVQDEYALGSHQKAVAATDRGTFKEEILPVEVPQRKGDPIVVATDEHPRRDTSLEKLAKLKPAFKKDGTVTAGNASGLNDGAAACLVMSAEKAKALGVAPMAKIRAWTSVGLDPATMGLGPIPATRKVLKLAGLRLEDVDLFEVNEAFAVQVEAFIREMKVDRARVNPNGGGVALGHPIGCSGARILTTLLHEMKRRGSKVGVATLCIGGGEGIATVVERV